MQPQVIVASTIRLRGASDSHVAATGVALRQQCATKPIFQHFSPDPVKGRRGNWWSFGFRASGPLESNGYFSHCLQLASLLVYYCPEANPRMSPSSLLLEPKFLKPIHGPLTEMGVSFVGILALSASPSTHLLGHLLSHRPAAVPFRTPRCAAFSHSVPAIPPSIVSSCLDHAVRFGDQRSLCRQWHRLSPFYIRGHRLRLGYSISTLFAWAVRARSVPTLNGLT